jgi:hypothetical protein
VSKLTIEIDNEFNQHLPIVRVLFDGEPVGMLQEVTLRATGESMATRLKLVRMPYNGDDHNRELFERIGRAMPFAALLNVDSEGKPIP